MTGGTQRRLAAIVLADVVGYSRLMGADETGTLAALRVHRSELIDPLISEHRGRIVKTMGDGLLLEFPSVVDATRCSIAIQQGMADRNPDAADTDAVRFRIGVHLGDVIVEGDDIVGDGVNIAARIEALADPGGIAISDDAHRQVRDRLDVTWRDGGEHEVKNIARAISVWRWSSDGDRVEASTYPGAPLAKTGEPSIAVLPFNNMSGDQEQGYFADGITEDIITELSKIAELLVISRNSTFTYKDKAVKAQDVCRDLGVRYTLEGSVRKAGARIRVTAQLIDGLSGGHLWAERYDRDLADIFAVQDDITEKIVSALEAKLVGAVVLRKHTANLEAYDCVLRGREQYRLFSTDSNAAARRLYERAIALDPDYAEPYAGLAETYVQDWFMGEQPALDRAFKLAQQAAARDPSLPLVQEALSTVHLFKKQHAEAIATARRWIELEPSSADAHTALAGASHFAGENEDVIALVEKATRLNPIYPFFYPHYIGLSHFAMRGYDQAAIALERSIEINSDVLWPHLFLAACYSHLGDSPAARSQVAEVRRINPEISIAWLLTFMPYKRSGDLELLVEGLRKAGL